MSTEETNHTLKKLIRQKKERSTELSLLQSKQRAGLRYRQRRKKHLENLCITDPEVATELLKLYKPSTIAVHNIDNVSPDLLQTIEEIARIGGVSNNDTRCLNSNQPCTSLDELREKIKERGYEIRRSSLFYRYRNRFCHLIHFIVLVLYRRVLFRKMEKNMSIQHLFDFENFKGLNKKNIQVID